MDETREEQSPPRNPFIDDEATEVSDADGQLEGEEEDESDPNDRMIVETLTETEDEANAIEDLEYLIDSDNWFNDDEFLNRIKTEKRRRIEIVSDSESESDFMLLHMLPASLCAKVIILLCIVLKLKRS